MGVIGIHDYDFFNYTNVLPNLECAKLCAYHKKNREIAVLAPELAPERFSTLYVRKDYDDGIYPKELFGSNIVLGGRAVSAGDYRPFPKEIERTIPDFSIYERHEENFGSLKKEGILFRRILGCAHIRLASDSKNIDDWLRKEDYLFQNTKGLIIHDYDISGINGAYDFIKDWLYSRNNMDGWTVRPYPLGTKFPIQVYSEEDLLRWLKLPIMRGVFGIQYNGLMEDTLCDKMRKIEESGANQLAYRVDVGCSSENDFLMNRLPKILPQVLFFHRHWIKISLTYDDNFITTPQLQNLFEVLNWFIRSRYYNYKTDKIVDYCKWIATHQDPFKCWKSRRPRAWPSTQEARDAFMYVRFNNYEVFKMFYEWKKVIFDGRRIINDTNGNSESN